MRAKRKQPNMSITFANQNENDQCLGCQHKDKTNTFPCYSALFCCEVNSQDQIKQGCPCRECIVKIKCKTTCKPKAQYYDKTFEIALKYSREVELN